MRLRLLLLTLTSALATAATAQSAVYKWVDKNGQAHYSSVPPSATLAPTTIVNTANQAAPSASSSPAAASTTAALTTITADDSAACKTARETLVKYLSASYLYTLGKDGKQRKLDPTQQTAAVAQAKNAVSQACSPQTPLP
jgi:hypothetical protein